MATTGRPAHRPSSYSLKKAEDICNQLACGKSLNDVLKAPGYPTKITIFRWLKAHEEFRILYAEARERQADSLVDDIQAIADDGANDTYVDDEGRQRTDYDVVARSKLRIEARKWLAGKMRPKVYGDVQRNVVELDAGEVAAAAKAAIAAALKDE